MDCAVKAFFKSNSRTTD